MTYLPGTDEAIYPGTEDIRVDEVIEDDVHNVVLDLTPLAFPADGFLPTHYRSLVDAGVWDAARVIGSNRSSHPVVLDAMDALRSEKTITQPFKFTFPPELAARIGQQLIDAAREREKCRYPGCCNYAVDPDFCAAHLVDEPAPDAMRRTA